LYVEVGKPDLSVGEVLVSLALLVQRQAITYRSIARSGASFILPQLKA